MSHVAALSDDARDSYTPSSSLPDLPGELAGSTGPEQHRRVAIEVPGGEERTRRSRGREKTWARPSSTSSHPLAWPFSGR